MSYLTIEHRGDFSDEQLAKLRSSRWIYGCDECLQCCPWNKQPPTAPSLFIGEEILEMSNGEFKNRYKNTPLERSGLKQIRRNYVGKSL
ncbi:MAG: hypothetical protein RR550_01755 [Rikenellaceae bacterium]